MWREFPRVRTIDGPKMDVSGVAVREQMDESLSRRSEFFRSRLIEEFRLLDCLSEQGSEKAPVYSSSNLIEGKYISRNAFD